MAHRTMAGVMPSVADLAQQATVLCPLPVSVQRVIALTSRPDVDFFQVGMAVRVDPALTASLLLAANASRFGRREAVTDIHRAVVQLGAREVQSAALTHAMVATFASRHERSGVVHARCALAAALGRDLASRVDVAPADAYLAGLLSELGALICLAVDGDEYGELVQLPMDRRAQAEIARYGASSRQVAARVLARHGLPTQLVEAVGTEDGGVAAPLTRLVRYCRRAAAALVTHADDPRVVDQLLPILDGWAAEEGLDIDGAEALALLREAGGELGRRLSEPPPRLA